MDCTKHIFSTFLLVAAVALFSNVSSVESTLITTKCEYYNHTICQDTGKGCNETEYCGVAEPNKRNHCYVLWQNSSNGELQIQFKGCFLNNFACYNQSKCVGQKEEPRKNLLFCCCEGDYCNREFSWEPLATETPPKNQGAPPLRSALEKPILNTLMYTLVPIVAITFMVVIGYWMYRRQRMAYFNELPTTEPQAIHPPSPTLTVSPVQLLEIKARGRFGAVWKGQLKTETVAVKIFPLQDKQSWLAEQEVFKLPQLDHANILQFMSAEKRGDSLQTEFWLITAFHEKGSLCDYLKCNSLSWTDLCRIAEGMARGLTHLHEEVPASKVDACKPAVAHRDFKSKNVLLKSDLTACIADFGLALIFYPGKPVGDTHGQVGTRRYMAPEVLEGAINFNRDAFLRIDMYACALVLWELLSRCRGQDAPVPEYLLPFEEEVGQHPTLEDMQECVVHLKRRPVLKEMWRQRRGMDILCHTIEECWDQDAEARLSASCVLERVTALTRLYPTTTFNTGQPVRIPAFLPPPPPNLNLTPNHNNYTTMSTGSVGPIPHTESNM
uniref:Serine/threonine-protein kinase receptor n=1 Tax=Daphnia galeata TaxID=27404 RepID=A0A8J2S0V4_9CRUS|nr:unnamed protein product [Daphnia galeata]